MGSRFPLGAGDVQLVISWLEETAPNQGTVCRRGSQSCRFRICRHNGLLELKSRLWRQRGLTLFVILVVSCELPVIFAQCTQVVHSDVAIGRPLFAAYSGTAAEQVLLTNKGNSTDYPTSIDSSNPVLTVTISWNQNFDSNETRYTVWIVESSTTLGAGLSSNLTAGVYSRTFRNAPLPDAATRGAWTLIATVNATDQTGHPYVDAYQWTVIVKGFTGTTTIPSSSTSSVTAESSHSTVTQSSCTTCGTGQGSTSVAPSNSISVGGSDSLLWLSAAVILAAVGWVVYQRRMKGQPRKETQG